MRRFAFSSPVIPLRLQSSGNVFALFLEQESDVDPPQVVAVDRERPIEIVVEILIIEVAQGVNILDLLDSKNVGLRVEDSQGGIIALYFCDCIGDEIALSAGNGDHSSCLDKLFVVALVPGQVQERVAIEEILDVERRDAESVRHGSSSLGADISAVAEVGAINVKDEDRVRHAPSWTQQSPPSLLDSEAFIKQILRLPQCRENEDAVRWKFVGNGL